MHPRLLSRSSPNGRGNSCSTAVTSTPRRGPTLRRIDKRQLREKMSSVADSTDGQETGFKNRHYFATMGLALARLRGSKLMPSSSTAETSHLPAYSVGSSQSPNSSSKGSGVGPALQPCVPVVG